MKRAPLAVLALVVGFAACQEATTSPSQANADRTAALNPLYRESNPPPPPIDTGGLMSFSAAASATALRPFKWEDPQNTSSLRFASALTESCNGTPTDIILHVTYMLNAGGANGYLHFSHNEGDSIWASSNGMVKLQNGTFNGKGTIAIVLDGCTLVINLASVNNSLSSFNGCGVFEEVVGPSAVPTRPPTGCFIVHFDDVTLNGEDIGGADLQAAPECVAGDERQACDPGIIPPPDIIG